MKRMKEIAKILLPLLLGGAILYWMYRGFDFERVRQVALRVKSSMNAVFVSLGVLLVIVIDE